MGATIFFQICLAMIVVLSSVNFSMGQDRCDGLGTETADLQLLFANDPYVDHYALISIFNCTQHIFSPPAKGTSGYDGSAVVVQKNSAMAYQFTLSADLKSADSITCTSGAQDHWQFLKFQLTSDGGWFCMFVCTADGVSFGNFLCLATDSSYFADETQALSLVAGVSNAGSIFDAFSNCPKPDNCAIFY